MLRLAAVLTLLSLATPPVSEAAARRPAASPQKDAASGGTHRPRQWQLRPGERFFRVDGTPTFLLGRNPTERDPQAFDRVFRSAAAAGESLVRLHLMHGIPPGGPAAQVDEAWAARWGRVLEHAARRRIAVIPVFTIWAQWNDGSNHELWHVWHDNPYNAARGGPARSPSELLGDTECRRLWLGWLARLVARWSRFPNIVAWEPFSEIDLLSGCSPSAAGAFVRAAADVVRASDPLRRPVTVSLSGVRDWPEVFGSPAVDIVQAHPYAPDPPYSGDLAGMLLDAVRDRLRRYGKPVLVGECGLDYRAPERTLTVAERARIGIRQAIWASAVSGGLGGRMLWWEDGYDKLERANLARRYEAAAAPVARFVRGVSYAGLKPAGVAVSKGLRGAALAGAGQVVGWFRDARCVAPDWPTPEMRDTGVSTPAPGSSRRWRVTFYDVHTGLPTGRRDLTSSGGRLLIRLPRFREAIALVARPSLRPHRPGR